MENLFPNTCKLKCSKRVNLRKTIYPHFISITTPISLKTNSPSSNLPKTTITQKAYKQSFLSVCGSVAPCRCNCSLFSSSKPKFIAKVLKNDNSVLILGKSILKLRYNLGKRHLTNSEINNSNSITSGNKVFF